MRKIGLTGGIASGKSVAAAYLEQLGAAVIDADIVSRQVVAPGSPALAAIVKHFGGKFLLPDGSLNRRLLREYIFDHDRQRERLNQILHPAIKEEMRRAMASADAAVVVLVAPLLLEAGFQDLCDEVWLLYVPESVQMARLLRRDGITRALAKAMIDSQMPFEEKRPYATEIINNCGDEEALKKELKALYFQIKEKEADEKENQSL